ncbi:TPA: hypothetical protein ACGW44_005429, partial [Bacillus toyonensis]
MNFKQNFDTILHDANSFSFISHPNLFTYEHAHMFKNNKYPSQNPMNQLRTTCEFNDPFGNTLRNYVT